MLMVKNDFLFLILDPVDQTNLFDNGLLKSSDSKEDISSVIKLFYLSLTWYCPSYIWLLDVYRSYKSIVRDVLFLLKVEFSINKVILTT